MEYLAKAALPALRAAPVVALVLAASRSRGAGPAVAFLALLVLDSFLVIGPVAYGIGQIPSAQWNWTGKALSLVGALAVLAFGPLSSREVGLPLRQRPGSARPAAIATAALVTFGVAIGLLFGGGKSLPAETVAYQLTMPGLAEELVFRGVFLALLHRAASEASEPSRVAGPWWPAAVTTLASALTHSPTLEGGRLSFSFLPLVAGAAFASLREGNAL